VTSAEKLCLACGLCCDGTLFGHVRLGPGDDAKQLAALGLPISKTRAKSPAAYHPQPCAALCADRSCRLYANRPGQCRSFECGVFKDAQAGRLEFPAALSLVKKARRLADRARALLRQLGDHEEHRPLDDRFHRMQTRMESGQADPAAAGIFADLSETLHRLHLLAHDKFHTLTYG
jgi:Fe-S-cluster containining protein